MTIEELSIVARKICAETFARGDGCMVVECTHCHDKWFIAECGMTSLYKKYTSECLKCKHTEKTLRITTAEEDKLGIFD